ncbi:MAG TPA: DUF58 domain-containing protein [Streptosporangiaceae bacterium]
MRAPFRSLTARGRSFVAVAGAAMVCGLAIPEPDLVEIGALLAVLPLVSALLAWRSRYRLSCTRRLDPPRVSAGRPVTVTARVENVSRLRTGVLLAEDLTPDTLGSRPRFVLDEIEPGGHRELSYPIQPDARGRFTIGPLRARVADAFGLVEITRSVSTTSTLVVMPRIVPLPRAAAADSWTGGKGGGTRTISAIGEDDAAPRLYRDGDGLRRVHWKSTARYGTLMVRHAEQQSCDSASVFLDTRRGAHAGRGPSASFEFAVSAAASIGAHLSGEGIRIRLITEAGEVAPHGIFDDSLLHMLAVISPSRQASLGAGTSALADAGGQLIAVAGRLSAAEARQLAKARRGHAPALALLLAVPAWGTDQACQDTAGAAEILSAAGWRVTVATESTPLAEAWRELHRPFERAGRVLPVASSGGDRW